MPMADDLPELAVADADAWRDWLGEHHNSPTGVWLALAKKGTTQPTSLSHQDRSRACTTTGRGSDMVRSAGMLLYRVDAGVLWVLIAHMGGPFWAHKDERAWSVPKGEYEEGDDPEAAALREFCEELGSPAPPGQLISLGTIRQSSGKQVTGYAVAADFDTASVQSNEFEMEWPRGSGVTRSFPEVDRAEWVDCATARVKLVSGQVAFLDRLLEWLGRHGIDAQEA